MLHRKWCSFESTANSEMRRMSWKYMYTVVCSPRDETWEYLMFMYFLEWEYVMLSFLEWEYLMLSFLEWEYLMLSFSRMRISHVIFFSNENSSCYLFSNENISCYLFSNENISFLFSRMWTARIYTLKYRIW